MSLNPKYQAVIMDMDGVLIDSPRTHLTAWRKALSTVQIHVTDLEIYVREGGKDEEICAEIAQLKNILLDKGQIGQVCTLKRKFFEELFNPQPIEGMLVFMKQLVLAKCRLLLVTGTVKNTVNKILQGLSLETMFEEVITGDALTFSKPHPEPYIKAIQLLGMSSRDCVVIENAPAGILSAKGAGLTCVALTTTLSQEFLHQADFVFHDVSTLKEWFFGQY